MGIERSRVMTRISEVPGCGNLVRRQYDHYLKLKFDVNWRWGRQSCQYACLSQGTPKTERDTAASG